MMSFEEAKKVFLDRGFVGVDENGDNIFDGDKLRQSYKVISEFLEEMDEEEIKDHKNDDFEEAKKVFLHRGIVPINENGDTLFDGNKWRQSYKVISDFLEEMDKHEIKDDKKHDDSALPIIYTVTTWDSSNPKVEPVIAAFSNKEAAQDYYDYFKDNKYDICFDEVTVYKKFTAEAETL